jgi:two-component system chemotaxis response regulator CheB
MLRVVLVADDRPARDDLRRAIERTGELAVVGQASSMIAMVRMLPQAVPDVIIVEHNLADDTMQSVVEAIMAQYPRPILVLTDPHHASATDTVQRALLAGAVDSFGGPVRWTEHHESRLRGRLVQISKVRVIGRSRVRPDPAARRSPGGPHASPVVALAASTGGPSALAIVLAGLGGLRAPVLVVQHLHAGFTSGLIDWMVRVSALPVAEATHGTVPVAGRVYFAPGGRHLRLGRNGQLELDELPQTLHRPSADELFRSVAERAGPAGIGVVMTGMGEDGAVGLLAIHRAGGRTIAQDEESCAVFGMPRAALQIGAVTSALPLAKLAPAVRQAVTDVTG